jgi:hypothetical protein
LLDERDRPQDYALRIAAGLPIVTVVAAVRVGCAAILAAVWWRVASWRAA